MEVEVKHDAGASATRYGQAFRDGTRVTVTLPDGTTEGFTFYGQQQTATYFATPDYLPRFQPDYGVRSRLIVDDVYLRKAGSEYIAFGGDIGETYTPANPSFGGAYTYIAKNGTELTFNAQSGQIYSIRDRNGNSLIFTHAGITSSAGRGVTFERDYADRITAIVDPAGRRIEYQYDAQGDLAAFWSRQAVADRESGEEVDPVRFGYHAMAGGDYIPHYLTDLTDGRSVHVMHVEFGSDGRIISMNDAAGIGALFDYRQDVDVNGERLFVETVSSAGTKTEFVRDSQGNLRRKIDWKTFTAGSETYVASVLQYDTQGNETHASAPFEIHADPLDPDWRFKAQPVTWTIRSTYDARGNVLSSTDALGNTSYYTYDASGNLLTASDPLGAIARFRYDSETGNLLQAIDALGNSTSYEYDNRGNRKAVVEGVNVNDPSSSTLSKTAYAYNDQGDLQSTTDARGLTTTFSYDQVGNRIGTQYTWADPNDPSNARVVSSQIAYDHSGQMTTTVDANGRISLQEYDVDGRPLRFTDAVGRSETRVYDALGNRVEISHSDGTLERFVFDDLGRPVIVANRHVPGQPAEGVRVTYDYAGRVTEKAFLGHVLISVVDDPRNPGTKKSIFVSASVYGTGRREYDEAGRLAVSTEPNGQVTRYEYDANGRQTAVTVEDQSGNAYRTEYEYDAAGRTVKVTDALQHETRYVYDAAGRGVKTVFHDDTWTETKYSPSGKIVEERDQAGRVTKYEYNSAGDRTAVILPLVRDVGSGNELVHPRIEYAYDKYGNLTTVTDANGHQTRFTYNAFGQQLTRELPTGETDHRVFDNIGRLSYEVDAKGQVATYLYDSLDRLSGKDFYAAGAATPDDWVRYEYDDFDRVTQVRDPRGESAYVYDVRNQLIEVASPEGVVHYEYDPLTRAHVRTYTGDPDAPTSDIAYGYDLFGYLETVTVLRQDGESVPESLQTTSYAYDAVGNLARVVLPNGVTGTYEYDTLNRLTSLSYKDAADIVLESFDYALTPDGRRDSVTDTRRESDGTYSTAVLDYIYDELGRLTREDVDSTVDARDYAVDYLYDLVGNRLTKSVDNDHDGAIDEISGYTYDQSDRLVSEIRGNVVVDYTYDANGSLVFMRTTDNGLETDEATYLYDVRNRLIAVDNDADGVNDVEYAYDDGGHRVAQTTNGETTLLLLDARNPSGVAQVLEEKTAAGAVTASYVHGFAPIIQCRDGQLRFYVGDGSRTTRLLTDSDGAIADRYSYDAFGVLLEHEGVTTNPHLFVGEWLDPITGRYNLRARDYDPAYGRLTQGDPLRGTDPSVLNQYVYANDDPVNFVDPTGRFSLAGMVGAIGAVASLYSIGASTYAIAHTVSELLDIRDLVILLREMTNAGYLDVEDFYEMQKEAYYTAAYLIGSAMSQSVDLAVEVASSFSYGQVFSFLAVGGGDVGYGVEQRLENSGEVVMEEEAGQASWLSVVRHHTLFRAALKPGVRQPLYRLRKWQHVGSKGLHTVLQNASNRVSGIPIKDLVPHNMPGGGKWTMKMAIRNAGGGAQWLQRMREAYRWLERTHPGRFKGVTHTFDRAVKMTGGAAGLKW
jgi:RHS repeat-associated protein